MKITFTIPTGVSLLRQWKWGLLAALALAFTFTIGGDGADAPALAHPGSGLVEMSVDAIPDTDGTPCSPIDAKGTGPTSSKYTADVCLENRTGAAFVLGAFNFRINYAAFLLPQQPACTAPAFNCNPDFDEASVTGSSWSCASPLPDADTGLNAPNGQAFISCANSAGDGPTLANNAVLRLANVRFATSAAPSSLMDLLVVNVFDNGISERLSCDPVITTAGVCHNATANPAGNYQEILINSNTSGLAAGPAGGACYQIDPFLAGPATFIVCDNETGAGVDSSTACSKDGDNLCTDTNPAHGDITVAVNSAAYDVTAVRPPAGHARDAHLKFCDPPLGVDIKCTFTHTPRPWFPGDVDGNGAVAGPDFFAVLQLFGQVNTK